MQRISAYIDGFNVYHPLDDYQHSSGICLKWLNYHSLVSSFLKTGQKLESIWFFSAINKYRSDSSIDRHQTYLKALRSVGVKVVLGRFKERRVRCGVDEEICLVKSSRDRIFKKQEEKRSDVHLAVRLVEDALKDNFDLAYLFSEDTDMIPAIEAVKRFDKEKKIIPVKLRHRFFNKHGETEFRFNKPGKLISVCGNKPKKLKMKDFYPHLFPESIKYKNQTIHRPENYMSSEQCHVKCKFR